MRRLLFCGLAFIGSLDAAEKQGDFNPADPTIWQEQEMPAAVREREKQKALCEATGHSATCPNVNGEQSDIQREQQRREDNHRYNDYEKHFKK